MPLVVYNTQTRTKEEFLPYNSPMVKMYCCGPTVYGLLHVGNFRGAIFYNLVRNWLEHLGYHVNMVYNYTDVDDKIINRAAKDGVAANVIADQYVNEFRADFTRLKLREHTLNPRVSETMPEIIKMIAELVEKNHAYVANGDVWYSIESFPDYGKLSNRQTDDLLAGVRIEKDENKKNPLDFALWKHSKPGEPSWESPWGPGRPGWHIECSAMVKKHLGEQIDIHGGGLDLMFPHHENEIAQSEGCTGKHYVKYWLHNNLIHFGGTKMSKSLGNIMTARSFMDAYNPEIFKYWLLATHYRSIVDMSETSMENAIRGLARIYSALAVADSVLGSSAAATEDPAFAKNTAVAWTGIEQALNDDFNTPEVMARIFEVVRQFNAQVKVGMKANPAVLGKAQAFKNFVAKVGALMSLFQEPAKEYLVALDDMLLKSLGHERAKIDALVKERVQARNAKDFKRSDELRAQLAQMGIAVMDSAEGSVWEVAK